ncbi:MAG: copper amine oxidase N-terminal domain-containing protein, partial [Peptococcaceae bacterium]|nr:copper amine oxidase N-terminal domain-containing protein [Peptococcaceae bacterium]
MRKFVSFALVAILILAMPLAALADAPVSLRTKGAPTALSGGALPYITDAGDTMVPLSYLDSLGIWTGWNNETGTATLINGKIASVAAGATSVDGADSAFALNLTIKEGIPFVKLRSASHIFGFGLTWDGATRT